MWRINQTPAWRELDHYFLYLPLSFSFLHLMNKKKEDMAIRQNKKREFWSKGFSEKIAEVIFIQKFYSIYRGKRSWTAFNSNFQSPKIGSRAKIFGQPNQQEINRRRQNTKPYLPVIMSPGFKETHDPIKERSSRSMHNWQPVVHPAIKFWRSAFIIQILVCPRTSKALKGLLPTPLFWFLVRMIQQSKNGGYL